jgi:glucosamine--fructose-6-phosphate aminotransferase (isomerizing)
MTSSQLEREIREQPAALARLLLEGDGPVRAAARRIRAAAPAWVTIAARGTSDNAARYAQYLFGTHLGLSVGLAVPSLFTLYAAPPRLAGALVIGVSQSGRSPDVVAVIAEGRRQGAVTLAITADPASPLAMAAELCIPLCCGEEKAVAATKTYTSSLLALAMLTAALADDDALWRALARVPEAAAHALALAGDDAGPAAAPFVRDGRLVVLGRGFEYATAFELALKAKETCGLLAEASSTADFRHGPVAMIDEGFPVVLLAPSGQAEGDLGELCGQLHARGARLLLLSDRAELPGGAAARLRLPAGLPEALAPIVSIVPGQLWVHALARARGLDPDAPRGLRKVTLTY